MVFPTKKGLPKLRQEPEKILVGRQLNAEGTAATARALHVGIIEFEAGTFHGFDIVDFNAFQIHGTHLVDGNFQTVKLKDLVGIVGLIFKRHVILETRAATAYDGNTQGYRRRVLHSHDFFDFGAGNGRQINHNSFGLRSLA
jgi:hypothetical protein